MADITTTQSVVKIGGRLISAVEGSLDLNDPPNYGGTVLGDVHTVRHDVGQEHRRVRDVVFNTASEYYWTGMRSVIGVSLRTWDVDALALVFPDTTVDSGAITITNDPTGTISPGFRLSGNKTTIVWAPDDTTNHPFIILDHAIPLLARNAQIALSHRDAVAIEVFFEGVPGD